MTKESIYELQKIDCNCNDCKFMERDFETYKKWEDWNKNYQQEDFNKRQAKAFGIANDCEDEAGKKALIAAARKMKFEFDKSLLSQYGTCTKLSKQVSFDPGTCQIHTQNALNTADHRISHQ